MPRIGSEMPALEGATEWFNATAARAEAESKGRPTLVHFWSISCDICKDHMPRVAEWRDKYADAGLSVVAVHMPRQPEDSDVEEVRAALSLMNISEPCAVDNEHRLRDAFENEQGYVPAYYLYDAQGKLKSFAAGQRAPEIIAPALERLLADAFKGTQENSQEASS